MTRRTFVRRAGVVILGLVGGLLAAAVLFVGCMRFFMVERLGAEVVSPDGAYVARAVEVNAGATTPFTTVVQVAQAGIPLIVPPHLLGVGTTVFNYRGRPESVSLSWQSPRELVIEYTDCREIYGKDPAWRDVTVTYVAKCTRGQDPGSAG